MDLKSEIFLQADPAARKRLPCPAPERPAIDGKVFAVEMTEREFMAYIDDMPDDRTGDKWRRARFLAFVLVDENGKRIFGTDVADYVKLANLPMSLITRWDKIAQALTPFGDEAKEQEKNSDAAASTTSSPSAA